MIDLPTLSIGFPFSKLDSALSGGPYAGTLREAVRVGAALPIVSRRPAHLIQFRTYHRRPSRPSFPPFLFSK